MGTQWAEVATISMVAAAVALTLRQSQGNRAKPASNQPRPGATIWTWRGAMAIWALPCDWRAQYCTRLAPIPRVSRVKFMTDTHTLETLGGCVAGRH